MVPTPEKLIEYYENIHNKLRFIIVNPKKKKEFDYFYNN